MYSLGILPVMGWDPAVDECFAVDIASKKRGREQISCL